MKEFQGLFNQIAYRHDFMRVFDDFLTMSICAFSFGRMEDIYLETIKGYSKEELNLFGNLLGALILEYENRSSDCGAWYDGLGDFFMDNNSKFGQDAKGQFFTPEPICNMIALTTAGEDNLNERRILDPAAGSGRLLIAFDRTNPRYRLENFYVACDIDSRCVKMCTLNFFLYGLKGAIIHTNSLTMEIWGGYRVYLTDTGLGIRLLDKYECLSFLVHPKSEEPEQEPKQDRHPEPVKTIQVLKPENSIQLSLFN
jgi:hypothetical protein